MENNDSSYEKITIQKIGPNELEALIDIAKQTFYEAFHAQNTEENMQQYLAEGFSEEKLLEELSHPLSSFYFALHHESPIGYLKLNEGDAQTDVKDLKALEIERIYVLSGFHGKGIGQLLFQKAYEVAKQKAFDYLWLGVWEKNPRAIHFYQKNGFEVFDTHLFRFGNEMQRDLMMKLVIKR